MAKKKKVIKEEIDEIPDGSVDEDGDELINLEDEYDNLEDDVIVDLNQIEDEMLADEDEDEEFGPEVDEVEKMLREMKCEPCSGSSSKIDCKIRNDFGCPPEKANK